MDAYAAPAGDAFRAPKCTPVTLYQSEEKPPAESASSQLAACEGFLAYAIKGGKIRVLARGSATRTLLRGHSQRIVDLAFGGGAAGAAASLASCCAGGRLCTWTVREGPGGDEVAHERGPELEIAGAVRLAWRPGPAPPPPPSRSGAFCGCSKTSLRGPKAHSRIWYPAGGGGGMAAALAIFEPFVRKSLRSVSAWLCTRRGRAVWVGSKLDGAEHLL